MTKFEKHGALQVNKSGKLVDKNGEVVTLHGYSSHGLSWYPQYINEDFFRQMRDEWCVDIVRLAMYTAEEDGYCVGDDANRQKLIEVVDRGVKAATELGLYCIIDWHILSDSNPLMNMDQAEKFFDLIAGKYADYSNVIYEICNEPNVESTWADIKKYADTIIPIIRKHDKDAVILVGTPSWSQFVDEPQKDPLTIDDNLMYVLHFYADTHRDDLRERFENAAKASLPLFISEFGCCDASGNGDNNFEQSDIWIELADKYDVSFVMWNLANRDESSASFVPECDKVTGFTDADLNPSAKWFIDVLKKHA